MPPLRLASCHDLDDVRKAARRRLPRPVADYIEGGADAEESLRNNVEAFRARRFVPRALNDVSAPRLTTSFFGAEAAFPLGLAPTGYTRMIDPAGEQAVARQAAAAGIPYVLSTMASTRIEEVTGGDRWFQLYIWKDRDLALELVRRARDSGYRVLEVAVDTAVSGRRLRDLRSGLTIPPKPTLKTVWDIGVRPRYWGRLLSSPRVEFANVAGAGGESGPGYTIADITTQFDPSLTWEALEEIRTAWDGPLVLKGPLGPEDALRAQAAGIDGVHLSNHGGRQLDRTVAPVELVRPVREAAGEDFGIFVDSGVRHGADLAAALALGADGCFIGRPYLWGLAAAGEEGVAHVIDLFRQQYRRTLQLLGMAGTAELQEAGEAIFPDTHQSHQMNAGRHL